MTRIHDKIEIRCKDVTGQQNFIIFFSRPVTSLLTMEDNRNEDALHMMK